MSPGRHVALASLLCTCASIARAQVSISAETGFNSQYVWRGVTSTNRPVIQPDVSLSLPIRRLTLTAGAWGNVEPVRYDGPRDLSSLNGMPGPIVTQSEVYTELAASIANRIDVSFGAQGYFYPKVGDLADYTTLELYSTTTISAPISPTISVNYDVGPIHGAYIEAGLTRAITGEHHGSVTVGASAGLSAGQATDPRGRDLAYFDRDGLTHVDASASATVSVGAVAFTPELHVIYANDALATVVAPETTRRVKLWFGTTLHWSSAR
jgi:hypothetical protein